MTPTSNEMISSPRSGQARGSGAGAGAEKVCVVRVHGWPLHAITEFECISHIIKELHAGRGGWVVTANLDHMRRLTHDPDYRNLCRHADLCVADGMPVIWASRLRRTPLPERVAGSSLVLTLSDAAAHAGLRIFLLGGAPGTAARAAQILQQRYPGLVIIGTACPEPGFEHDPAALAELQKKITSAQPHIIYVALGSPKQEHLISALRPALPTAWWLGVGISFSFICGDVRRAPAWVQRCGLEWLHRLVQEPRRLGRRYLVHGVPFAIVLLARALAERYRKQGSNRNSED